MNPESGQLLFRIRILIGIVIGGLVVSGLTAFPLLYEIDLLHRWLVVSAAPASLVAWIGKVHEGLQVTYSSHPFLGYGTDWLAFGHLVIAVFFVGAFTDPVRNVWTITAGQIACVGVIPLAQICGEIREIPLGWRAIDCAFGVFGFIPLWVARRLIRQLDARNPVAPPPAVLK